MKLKTVTEPPRDGTQFIASWVYNNVPWSGTYKYKRGEIWRADEEAEFRITDSYFPVGVSITYQITEPKPLTTKEILIALGEGKTLVTEHGTKYVLEDGYLMDWCGNEHSISALITDQVIIKAE